MTKIQAFVCRVGSRCSKAAVRLVRQTARQLRRGLRQAAQNSIHLYYDPYALVQLYLLMYHGDINKFVYISVPMF